MLHVSPYEIAEILSVTVTFILHIMTFYTLTTYWETNMVIFETFVYGTFFVVKIGYLIAVLTDGNFTPPLEAMTKLNGAVLFNIASLMTLLAVFSGPEDQRITFKSVRTGYYFMICKGLSGLVFVYGPNMLHLSSLQITQIITITLVFILHLLTFYDMSIFSASNMALVETPIYGTYFIIKLGYLIAVLTDGTFTPPLEAMIKLNGAVLYNVMGIVTLVTYYDRLKDLTLSNEKINDWLMIAKGLSSLVVSILYYVEVFQT